MKLAKNLQRLGTESAFSVLAEAKKLEAQGKPMIHLGLGQPDFKTPQHVVDAAKKHQMRVIMDMFYQTEFQSADKPLQEKLKNFIIKILIQKEY